MPVKTSIPYKFGTFFVTFTCYNWLPLIEEINGYDIVYNWFDHLKSRGHYINAYVVMPNHIHCILTFIDTNQSINTIIGNGKRFMAYEIIKRLKSRDDKRLIELLSGNIETKRRSNNKRHNIWELSFDWKECVGNRFVEQKLDYIHNNPCAGKWNLSSSPIDYLHSSARYYLEGCHATYIVTNIMEMNDVAFEL